MITNQFQTTPEVEKPEIDFQEARLFFSRCEDFNMLSAATERLFPKDDLGAGAIELAVPYFIDKQLNSSWGTNAHAYMQGPFMQYAYVRDYEKQDREQSQQGPYTEVMPDIPTPRYQTRLNRGEMFLLGLRTMDRASQKKFDASFDKLEGW